MKVLVTDAVIVRLLVAEVFVREDVEGVKVLVPVRVKLFEKVAEVWLVVFLAVTVDGLLAAALDVLVLVDVFFFGLVVVLFFFLVVVFFTGARFWYRGSKLISSVSRPSSSLPERNAPFEASPCPIASV